MTVADSCPYRCRCGHRWETSRLTPAYHHLHAAPAANTRKAAA